MKLPDKYVGYTNTHRYRVTVEPITHLEYINYNYQVFTFNFRDTVDQHVAELPEVQDQYLYFKLVEVDEQGNSNTADVIVYVLFEILDAPSFKLPTSFQVDSVNGRYQISVVRVNPATDMVYTLVLYREEFLGKIKEFTTLLKPDYNAYIHVLLIIYNDGLYDTQQLKVNIELTPKEPPMDDPSHRILNFRRFVDDLGQSGELE